MKKLLGGFAVVGLAASMSLGAGAVAHAKDKTLTVLRMIESDNYDQPARQSLFDRMHRHFIATAPMIVFYNGVDSVAHSTRIEGYRPWLGAKPRLWGVWVVR